jgi:hypothetical protein
VRKKSEEFMERQEVKKTKETEGEVKREDLEGREEHIKGIVSRD